MADKIKCSIVSGAPNDCAEFLKSNIDKDSFIIAADSGYLHLIKAEIKPDLIIADFDSCEKPEIDCEILTYPWEKSYTDTFNCVRYAVEKGFNDISIYNAIGSRFDHTYANVLCLDYCRKNGVKCRIVDEHNRLTLIRGEYTFEKDYDYFSLIAFLGDCKGVKIEGAHFSPEWYGNDEMDIYESEQTAFCNFIENEKCTISVKEGTLLLAESRD